MNFFILDNPNKLFRLNVITIIFVALSLMILGIINESHGAEIETGVKYTLGKADETGYDLDGNAWNVYTLFGDNGTEIGVFCIEHKNNNYCSDRVMSRVNIEKDPDYWEKFTKTQKRGISAAASYGYRNGASVPSELREKGVDKIDLWAATQAIIWEYQEKYRDGIGIDNDGSINYTGIGSQNDRGLHNKVYYNDLGTRNGKSTDAGRIAYRYIIDKIYEHNTRPSFTREDPNNITSSEVIKLKHSYSTNSFDSGIIKDTKETMRVKCTKNCVSTIKENGEDVTTGSGNIKMTGSGSEYRFTTDEVITESDGRVLTLEKRLEGKNHDTSFIWTGSDDGGKCQTMYSGDTPYGFDLYTKVKTEKPGYISGKKVSGDDAKLQIGKNIYSDVVFTLKRNETDSKTWTLKLNSSGQLVVSGTTNTKIELYPGSYTLTENTLDRYQVPITVNFELSEGEYIQDVLSLCDKTKNPTCKNTPKTGDIEFKKFKKDPNLPNGNSSLLVPEANAKFRVYSKDFADAGWTFDAIQEKAPGYSAEFVTNSEGIGKSSKLNYGEYIIEQVEGDKTTFKCPKTTVFINEHNKTYYFVCENEPVHAKLKIIKKDLESGKIIPYAGISFKIKDSDGNYVKMSDKNATPTEIDTFKTDDTGTVELPGHLSYGTYTIVEVTAPLGYYRNPEGAQFTIDQNSIEDANDGQINTFEKPIVVEFKDKPQLVDLNITKVGEEIKEEDDKTEVIEAPLAYAEFELIAAEDITTLDGRVHHKKGDSLGKVKTNFDGKASYNDLYLGKYELYEKEFIIKNMYLTSLMKIKISY